MGSAEPPMHHPTANPKFQAPARNLGHLVQVLIVGKYTAVNGATHPVRIWNLASMRVSGWILSPARGGLRINSIYVQGYWKDGLVINLGP